MNKTIISVFLFLLLASSSYINAQEDITALKEEYNLQDPHGSEIAAFAAMLIDGEIPLGPTTKGTSRIKDLSTKINNTFNNRPIGSKHLDRDARVLGDLISLEEQLQESQELYQLIENNNIYLLGPNMYITRDQIVDALVQQVVMGQITPEQAQAAAGRYGDARRLQSNQIRQELENIEQHLATVRESIQEEEEARERLVEARRQEEEAEQRRLGDGARRSLATEQQRRRAAAEQQRLEEQRRQQQQEQRRRQQQSTQPSRPPITNRGRTRQRSNIQDPGLGNLGSDLSDIFSN